MACSMCVCIHEWRVSEWNTNNLKAAKEAGFGWVRTGIDIGTSVDRLNMAKQAGLCVLGMVYGPGCFYGPGDICNQSFAGINDYKTFITQMANKFANVVDAWEIWNEPSTNPVFHRGWFRGEPSKYVQMLQVASDAIKRADPGAVVLGGADIINNESSYNWMKQIHSLGAYNYVVPSVHVYYKAAWNSNYTNWLRARFDEFHNLARKPIWITEAGQSSYNLDQCNMINNFVPMAKSLRYVDALFWYEWSDTIDAGAEGHYGLVDKNGNKKPSFYCFWGLPQPSPTPAPSPTPSPTPTPTSTTPVISVSSLTAKVGQAIEIDVKNAYGDLYLVVNGVEKHIGQTQGDATIKYVFSSPGLYSIVAKVCK